MIILNPNKYLKKAYLDVIRGRSYLAFYKVIPKDITPTGEYIVLDNITKNETVKAKTEVPLTYFEWLLTIDVNIYAINKKGFSRDALVDDVEENIISMIRPGISIGGGFVIKSIDILESISLNAETETQSIDRRLVKFQNWISREVVP